MSAMEQFKTRHLVIVRHGESEGDVRRAAFRRGEVPDIVKRPVDEAQTDRGHEQSLAAGLWIAKHVLAYFGITAFDICLTSPLIRARHSAASLEISDEWSVDNRLSERNRGLIQGLSIEQHRTRFPKSYEQMNAHPFHWVPPGGESILRLSRRFGDLLEGLDHTDNVLMMTHRDVMWAGHMPLDHMRLADVEAVDTNEIHNGQVFHYTNVDPSSGQAAGTELVWKRSVCPWEELPGGSDPGGIWSRLPD